MPVMTDEGAEAVPAGETEAVVEPPAAEIVEGTAETAEIVEIVEGNVETPETPESGAAAEQPAISNRARVGLRAVAVAAAVAVLVGAAGLLGWEVWQQRQLTAAGEEAQRTAVRYAEVLTSIDSDKVDENFRGVLDGATGEFKDMYSQSSVELRQLLIENKATARGVVVESAVQSASKDNAVVLLFVDQSVSNAKLPDPRIDRSRMKMTLERVDGRWRASKVELP